MLDHAANSFVWTSRLDTCILANKITAFQSQMLKPTSTPDLIADVLRGEIGRGIIRPGTPLRQEALAERFAVSRIPVRDALRQLEGEGVVTVVPNRGAFVAELTIEEVREICHLRQLVEVDLIGAAVPRMDRSAVHDIQEKADLAARLSSTIDWIEGDRMFHRALYAPARRPRQLELAMSLRTAIERYDAVYRKLPAKRLSWLRDHASLIEACRRGDTDAARERLSDHLGRAAAFLISQIVPTNSLTADSFADPLAEGPRGGGRR
jgi:DNA-binding GntR family transcriptional regulator